MKTTNQEHTQEINFPTPIQAELEAIKLHVAQLGDVDMYSYKKGFLECYNYIKNEINTNNTTNTDNNKLFSDG